MYDMYVIEALSTYCKVVPYVFIVGEQPLSIPSQRASVDFCADFVRASDHPFLQMLCIQWLHSSEKWWKSGGK